MNLLSKQPIGKQLAIGFGLVALIALFLGGLGYYGTDRNETAMQEVGNVQLPGIANVLKMEIHLGGLIMAMRNLLNPILDMEARQHQYRQFNENRQAYRAAADVYITLPQIPEEAREWDAFMRILPEWIRANDQILELHRELDLTGILNPDKLLWNLQRFRGNHLTLEVQVSNMLLTGRLSESGDDDDGHAFGHRLSDITSTNPEFIRIVSSMQQPHNRFHEAVVQIRNAVRDQNTEAATRIFTQTMQPASREVLQHLDQLIAMVERAESLQGRVAELTMGATLDMQRQAQAHLAGVVRINHEIAEQNVSRAIAQASLLKTSSLAAMAIGVLIAVAFGFFIRRNVATILKDIMRETSNLVDAAVGGKLAVRADTRGIHPEFRPIAEGFNNVLDAVIGPLNVAAEYVDRISKGDIPPTIKDTYNGDFNEIKNNLNQCIEAVNLLVQDTRMLSAAAVQGKLATRADASRHQGDFSAVVTGINDTLDAVIGPLNVAAEYVDRISKGDVPPRITDSYSGDFNEIKNNLNLLIDAMNEVTDVATEISAGNLTVRVRERSAQDKLIQAMGTMAGGLTEVASNIQTVAAQVMMGSQEMNASSEQLSQGATEQSASVEEVSSSMEEMAANIKQNSDNARQTEKIALKAAEDAMEGGQAVSQTVSAMKEIAGKISIIEEIARQTNLLALNAAIEAARAGEHGKGFAVVASEVRKLAERSQKAAGEINNLSASSVQIAEKAGEMLAGIVPDIQKTADLVQEITAASNEQSSGADQINKAIQQLDQVVQQNASAAEEMASTSTELLAQAEQLQTTIAFFKIDGSARKSKASPARRSTHHAIPQPRLPAPSGKTGGETAGNMPKGTQTPGHKSGLGKGIFLDMGKGVQSDATDDEFERY